MGSKKRSFKGTKLALGQIRKGLAQAENVLVDGSCGVDGGEVCVQRLDLVRFQKDLSRISDLIVNFADDLEVAEARAVVGDYDEIDNKIQSIQSSLDDALGGGVRSNGVRSDLEEQDDEAEQDDDEENREEENEAESEVESLGYRRRVEREGSKK